MGALARRVLARDSGCAGWTVRCAQAMVRLHHACKLDTGVSECIDPFVRLHTHCYVLVTLSPMHIGHRTGLAGHSSMTCRPPVGSRKQRKA